MKQLRVGVVGGSIGGLTAAVLLHEMGCDVEVFERSSAALQGRGAGIVVLPMTERYFTELGTSLGAGGGTAREVALTLTNWSYIDRDGTIVDEAATHNRFTSWNTLYRALRDFLSGASHLDGAPAGWETQQMALAGRIAAKSRAMGEASQTAGAMVPGDPDWRFGLFGPGN